MSEEFCIPVAASFYRKPDNTYELNQVYALESRTPGTLGALFGPLTIYDVDWSDTFGSYLFHMSGSGSSRPIEISGPYWSRRRSDVKEEPCQLVSIREYRRGCELGPRTLRLREWNRTRRLPEIPFGIEECSNIMDYLTRYGINEESVYCSVCRDHLPSDELCEHCWWCDSVGWYVTPDEGKICFDPDCWACSRRRRERHELYMRQKRYERFWAVLG